MRISRIFIDQTIQTGSVVELSDQNSHYLIKVLRLSIEAEVILFNNDGFEYSGRLVNLSKKHAHVEIHQQLAPATESTLHTILGIGISRGERMDYAIQKSTELGVSEFVPLFTERGEVKLKGERLLKRQAHWQQVAISACEQSGRVIVPKVHQPILLTDWIKSLECAHKLVFDHRQSQALESSKPEGEIALLIGPEGGLSEKEVTAAKNNGFAGIKLGPRVLRTETAPVTVLSVLQYVWGDFQP